MYRPRLIIGIGGSGGKTIRAMKDALEFRLKQKQLDLPDCWQFLQIDTTDDGLEFPARMLPSNQKCIVVNQGMTFDTIRDSLERLAGDAEERNMMLAGWGIKRTTFQVSKGAGMVRGIGRQVGIAAATKIQNSLNDALTKMLSGSPDADLQRIARALSDDQNQAGAVDAKNPQVMFVTSLAGGSGAGMFLDVMEILKRNPIHGANDWIQNGISFLYTAEVFENVAAAPDVRQNSLGAVNEITSGIMRGPTASTEILMDKLSLTPSTSNQIGTGLNVLIGSKNSAGVDLSKSPQGNGMNEIFYTVGETLAALTLNPELSEKFLNKQVINVFQSDLKITDTSGFAPKRSDGLDQIAHPFAAIGFARLSVGVDRVLEFIRDAMTRAQVEKLLFPETIDTHLLIQNNQTKEDVVKEIIDGKLGVDETLQGGLWMEFLKKSKLREFGLNNDVTDCLQFDGDKSPISDLPGFPKEMNTVATIDRFPNLVMSDFISRDKPVDVSQITRLLHQNFESARDKFDTEVSDNLNLLASFWARNQQRDFLDVVAEFVSLQGLEITIRLLKRLISDDKEGILAVANSDLRTEIETASKTAKIDDVSFFRERIDLHAKGRAQLSAADKDFVSGLASDFRTIASRREEVARKSLAAELMKDFANGFITPLIDLLSSHKTKLYTQWSTKDLARNHGIAISEFPDLIGSENIVPSKYRPKVIEMTLIDPAEYFDFYTRIAGVNVSQSERGNKTRIFEKSYQRGLLGTDLDDDALKPKRQSFIVCESEWVPSATGMSSSRFAQLKMSLDLLDLQMRNRKWLAEPDSEFGKAIDTSIQAYCKAGDVLQIQEERAEKFIQAYSQLLTLSAPLANYNQGAFKALSDAADQDVFNKFLIEADKVPFSVEHPIGKRMEPIISSFLDRSGLRQSTDPSFIGDWFDDSSNARELFALQLPLGALPAYAFGSLTAPITRSIRETKSNPVAWANYWKNRRTRPLAESVPVDDGTLQSLVCGWFIAKKFGLISEISEAGKLGSNYLRIMNPLEANSYFNFPEPLLESTIADSSFQFKLPSVLMSLGIALVNFGETGDLSHLHSYRILKWLGREVTTAAQMDAWDAAGGDFLFNSTPKPCTFLKDWVQGTSQVETMTQGVFEGVSVDLSTLNAESRKDYLIGEFELSIVDHAELWQSMIQMSWNELPNEWEIRNLVDSSLALIKTHIAGISGSFAGDRAGNR